MYPDYAWANINSDLVIAKDYRGYVYLPGVINGMGYLTPGQGYRVKMMNAGVLTYPANNRVAGGDNYIAPKDPEHYVQNINTGNNASIIILESCAKTLEVGDEVGVFNSRGILCGGGVYNGSSFAFPIWGNDLNRSNYEYLREQDEFEFRIWSKGLNKEFIADVTSKEGPLTYSENGIYFLNSIVSRDLVDQSIDHNGITVYPNPANVVLNFKLQLLEESAINLSIFDLQGREVVHEYLGIVPSGVSENHLDVSSLPTGAYFYKTIMRNQVYTGAIVISQ